LGHGYGIVVGVIDGVGDAEAGAFLSQVSAAALVTGDGGSRVVVHGSDFAGGVTTGGVVGVIGPYSVLDAGPPLRDGVLEAEGVALENLGPSAGGNLPLQLISGQVSLAIIARRPG